MSVPPPSSTAHMGTFTVGDWRVEPRSCLITRGDRTQRLRPQLIDLLVCLAKRPGTIVLRDEILSEVWAGQFVAESALSRCVTELRQVLGDDAQHPTYIDAIRKRGYRLIAPVAWSDPAAAPLASPEKPDAGVESDAAAAPSEGVAPIQGEEPPARPVRAEARRGGTRRAWLWALATAAVVMGIVAVIMVRRGPAGVLTDRDRVLLAFENLTGDPVFDETIPTAMSIQLEQSPYLALISPRHIEDTLRMMEKPTNTPLTRVVGLEVCERVGGRAVIVTSIASMGRQYVVGAEAVACDSQTVLTRQQITVGGKEQVLGALQQAAERIRRTIGESGSSVDRFNVPVVQATTSSLDALRALRRGDAARDRGEWRVALGQYREAVSIDADFALAHQRRGILALAGGGTEDERYQAFERAYQLRERVTLPERMEIEAGYHLYVTGNRALIIGALESLVRTYPKRAEFRASLADRHVESGQLEAALAQAQEALRLEPDSLDALATVGLAQLYLNRIAEAKAAAEKIIALGGTSPSPYYILFHCGLATGDKALLARARAWAAQHPDQAIPYILEGEAEEAMSRGHLRESLALLAKWEASAVASGRPMQAAMLRLRMARYEALCGLRAEALRRVNEELRHELTPVLQLDVVKVAVSAEAFDLATKMLDGLDRIPAMGVAQPGATLMPAYRAAVEMSQGRADRALARLTPLEDLDLGMSFGFIPLFERGRAHAALGHWADARSAFKKILDHPTIDSGQKLVPLALVELARTLARAGDLAASRAAYQQFFERWKDADAGLPLLEQARREFAALPR